MTKGGNIYYYQYNAHGDVVSLTNSAGQIVNSYEYDPWGKVLSANEQMSNPYRYAGYRYDSSTGLYYLQKRYYKPDIYRFLNKDPQQGDLRNPQTLNSYIYVNNNPVNFVDPTGLKSWLAWGPTIFSGTSAVLGTVSLVAAVVPGGQPVAMLAGAGAMLATGASILATSAQYYTGEITPEEALVSVGLSGTSLAFGGASLARGPLALGANVLSRAFGYGSFGWETASLFNNKTPTAPLSKWQLSKVVR